MNRVFASAMPLVAVFSIVTAQAHAQTTAQAPDPAPRSEVNADGTVRTTQGVQAAPPAAYAEPRPVVTTTGPASNHNDELLARNARGEIIALDDRAGFGTKRQWAFSSDAALSFSRTTQSDVDGAVTQVTLAPAADYFIIENLSVGGAVGLVYTKAGENNGVRFTLGPRVGYNFEISRLLSVWPKIGFSYAHTNQDVATITIDGQRVTQTGTSNSLALNLFVPVMIHPAPHFFAGLGPFVDADLSGDNRATSWGLKLTLGGWINTKPRG